MSISIVNKDGITDYCGGAGDPSAISTDPNNLIEMGSDGKLYAGKQIQFITKAAYDALPETSEGKLNPNVVYNITDDDAEVIRIVDDAVSNNTVWSSEKTKNYSLSKPELLFQRINSKASYDAGIRPANISTFTTFQLLDNKKLSDYFMILLELNEFEGVLASSLIPMDMFLKSVDGTNNAVSYPGGRYAVYCNYSDDTHIRVRTDDTQTNGVIGISIYGLK